MIERMQREKERVKKGVNGGRFEREEGMTPRWWG
jgi:hypothetical protein